MKQKIFLLPLLLASSLFASNDCVTYEVNCSALYLQPNSSNLYYGAEAIPLPLPSPSWKSLEIQPDLHLGFDIGVKTVFNRTQTSLQLNWERLHSNDSSSKHVSSENMLGPYFNIGPDAFAYTNAHGHVNHEFDAVNLNFGKQFDCWGCLEGNFFGGLAFTRIKQTVTSKFSNDDETITRHIKAPSQFTGAGPEFGIDAVYHLCGNFSLTGETSMALFFGGLKNRTTFLSRSPLLSGLSITPPNKQTTSVPNRTQLVPGFGGKLGLSYETCFNCNTISIDFGYQVQAYLNAIQSVDMTTEVTVPPVASEVGVFALGFQRTVSNFLLTGPYLTLSVAF